MLRSSHTLVLREAEPGDAATIHRLANDPAVAQWCRIQSPLSFVEVERWLARWDRERREGKGYWFAIVAREAVLACIGLTAIRHENRAAWLTYWLGRDFWGQGYASAAASSIVQWARQELNLARIWSCA